MKLRDVSLRWKLAPPIILSIAAGIAITAAVIGYTTESIVINELKKSAFAGYRDTVLNSLTSLMTSSNYDEAKAPGGSPIFDCAY